MQLVTTITNRSSHMPTLTISEMTNKTAIFRRILRDHSSCGTRPLQKISIQYMYQ